MATGNFFQTLISSILGGGDADAVKRKMLRKTAKNLSKTKFHFYRYNSHEADASLAKFFYEIYKAVSPAQLMFANTNPNVLKRIVIEDGLSENQRTLQDSLTEEAITALARSTPLPQVVQQVNGMLESFNAEFTSEKITQTDALYTNLLLLQNFCQYDFYFLLKKFDNTLHERSFDAPPHFQSINGTYVTEDLKNFIAVAWALPPDADWESVFKLLKAVKGVEPISLNIWKKILARLKMVRDQHILEMVIQLITENPAYKENIKGEEHHIMDDFISQTRHTAEETLEDLKAKQTAGKVDGLLSQIFGEGTVIEPMKNYNDSSSEILTRKNFTGYTYCDPLSYLRQFLLDYVKKDLRELSDILLVRGEWSAQTLSQPMSEAFHALMEITKQISAFDEKCSESGEFGNKFKSILPRVDRDKESRNICTIVLNDANNEAAQLLISARTQMVNYARNLKMLLEDFMKQQPNKIIINWTDLNNHAEGKLKQKCVDVYKQIFAFVSLLQNFDIAIKDS